MPVKGDINFKTSLLEFLSMKTSRVQSKQSLNSVGGFRTHEGPLC